MSATPVPWSVPMGPRDSEEPHRAATPLELFFDLVFVVAIAAGAAELHHGLAEGHLEAAVYFVLVFVAVWWAWVGYTWFASAYDSGDVVFRLLSLVIMAGSLLLAAGVPDLFDDGQSALVVAGYCVMRLAMVTLWLRAARGHPEGRTAALWYAGGIAAVQVFWLARLLVDGQPVLLGTFVLGMTLEFTVPWLAERHHRTPYHPDHIAERYGLFTIIVLGEVVLSSVLAVQEALAEGEHAGHLAALVGGGMLVVFSLWWLYFKWDHAPLFADVRTVFPAAYAHAFGFAATAATGAGIAAAVDVVTHHAHASTAFVAWSVAVPVVVFLGSLGLLHVLGGDGLPSARPAVLTAAAVVAATGLGLAVGASIGMLVLLVGLVLAGSVAQHVISTRT